MKKEQRKEAFIKFCLEKFGDQFDYSKVDYQSNSSDGDGYRELYYRVPY